MYSTPLDTADYERFARLDYSDEDVARWERAVEWRIDAQIEEEQMSVMVKDNGGGKAPPAGVHNAVCARVWDLGEQPGFEGKMQHKIVLVWELDARIEDGEHAGKRYITMQSYTASLNEKARLRQHLEAWRGRAFSQEELTAGFDVEKLIGKQCQMNLVEYAKKNGGTGTKIASIMPPPANAPQMEVELDESYMPEWVKEALGKKEKEDTFEDDVPF